MMRRICRRLSLLFALAMVASFAQPAATKQAEPSAAEMESRERTLQMARETLKQSKIEPTAQGAQQLIERLAPSAELDQWIRERLDELNHEDYSIRERATDQLATTPAAVESLLKLAEASDEAEVRWRARNASIGRQSRVPALLQACLVLLEREPSAANVVQLVDAAESFSSDALQGRYFEVLERSAREPFREALDKRLKSPTPTIKLAAAIAISKIDPSVSQTLLAQLETDENDQVVLGYCRLMLRRKDRRVLQPLVRLLSSEDLASRRSAYRYLVAISGHTFAYNPTLPAADRQASRDRWQTWLTEEAPTAKIHLPPRLTQTDRAELGDQLLIATGATGKVRILDAEGRTTWEHNAQSWHAEKMTSGNVMIASHWTNHVVEVSPTGDIVWSHAGVNAIRAMPLVGGTVLIADFAGKRAVEVSRGGNVVWQFSVPDNCFAAERLDDGNTLVACPSTVFEVSRDGQIRHRWNVKGRLNSVQMLPSGELLVADYQGDRVVRLDRESNEVWTAPVTRPTDAFLSPEGRLLIGTATQLIEIDPKGEVLRTISRAQSGSIRGS